MENQNPGRSVKDRAALHIIEDAMDAGELSSGDNLYESTSGSTGISLGLVCNVKGINTRIYLNNDLAKEKVQLEFLTFLTSMIFLSSSAASFTKSPR